MDPLKIYDYLIITRERVFDRIRRLTPEQYNRRFTIGLKSLGSTLTHLMISEWYYIERLERRDVPHYDTWPIKYESPPAFEVIERTWREQSTRIRAVIAAECATAATSVSIIPAQAGIQRESSGAVDAHLREHDGNSRKSGGGGGWSRVITWLSFPDDTRDNKRFHITCTAGDLFTQLALHEVHHRAQIMAMLREIDPTRPLEDLDYNALMYQRVEAT